MSDDGPGDSLFRAPSQLRPNRRMADESLSAPANERARERRTVADVNLYVFKRCGPVANEHEVWRVEYARPARTHAIGNCGCKNRVFHRKRLKCDAVNLRRHAFLDQMSILDVAVFQCVPCLLRR